MKLKYLGTAAAEGYPAMFCDCENCRRALKEKGKNIRSRSQAIVDNELLIDFPCDTYYHCMLNDINLHDIHNCLITHVHRDHLYPVDFLYFKNGFSHPAPDYKLNLYGSVDVEKIISELPSAITKYLNFVKVNLFEPFKAGKYTVTPMKAYHGTENPYIYAISDGEKSILYAHDTDIFPEETWEYMKTNKMYFDLVSMDCTEGAYEELNYHGHMCLGRNVKCRDRMLEGKMIDEKTKLVLNHFSHNGIHSNYTDFVPLAADKGFEVAFDGMEIDV